MKNNIIQRSDYSTTRLLTREQPVIEHKPEDKFESYLFLPEGEDRKGEGGLRTQGYFKKSYDDKPLISIITVVFNGEKYLEETIQSVINQTYDNVEYIIIDGGSTDGTLDIIKKYKDQIDYWVSEPDGGIYDAMNKGVKLATGMWINCMNGGDAFFDIKVLKNIFSQSIGSSLNIVFGKSVTFYNDYEKLRYIDFCSGNKNFYLTKMPNHQAVFVSRFLYKKLIYDTRYNFYSDTDYLRRCFVRGNYKETEAIVSRFELGGISNFYKTYENFKLLVDDSYMISGNWLQSHIKHTIKFLLQILLGKHIYLIVYIKWILK